MNKNSIKFHLRKRRYKSIMSDANLCFFSLFKQWAPVEGTSVTCTILIK